MPDPNTNCRGLVTYVATTVAAIGGAASVNNLGQKQYVNDSTLGNQVGRGLTAAGGGTYAAYVRSNGVAWKIA